MPCNHPLKAFRTGNLTDNGKEELVICPSTAGDFCNVGYAEKRGFKVTTFAPQVVSNGNTFLVDPIPIPCGQCIGCRKDYAKEWTNRAVLESQSWDNCYFITLTYDNVHCPTGLVKTDLQKFFKRLRDGDKGFSFRYLACGEYGDLLGRPHYHIILFTDHELDLYDSIGPNAYHCSEIEQCWKFGLHEVSIADSSCMAYVAGYVEKKWKKLDDHPVKPFLLMSRKPALGSAYLDSHPDILETGKVYGAFGVGHFASIPRYFIRKLENSVNLEAYKKKCRLQGERSSSIDITVYDDTDVESIGIRKDEIIKKSLENKRISKL